MEGNIKGVMKVILALAERYQPKSVKARGAPEPANHTAPVTPDHNLPRQELVRLYSHPQTATRPEYGLSPSSLHPPNFRHQIAPPGGPLGVGMATEEMYSNPADQLPSHNPPQVCLNVQTVSHNHVYSMCMYIMYIM